MMTETRGAPISDFRLRQHLADRAADALDIGAVIAGNSGSVTVSRAIRSCSQFPLAVARRGTAW